VIGALTACDPDPMLVALVLWPYEVEVPYWKYQLESLLLGSATPFSAAEVLVRSVTPPVVAGFAALAPAAGIERNAATRAIASRFHMTRLIGNSRA
jgi:hypothetical protein